MEENRSAVMGGAVHFLLRQSHLVIKMEKGKMHCIQRETVRHLPSRMIHCWAILVNNVLQCLTVFYSMFYSIQNCGDVPYCAFNYTVSYCSALT